MNIPHGTAKSTREQTFSIIGIGMSAGGLDALKAFLRSIPPDCRHSFVVIQHLSSEVKSVMSELLSRVTTIQVKEVKKTTSIDPGSLYLIPPANNLILKKGNLHLVPRSDRTKINLPVDVFFNSMAEELGKEAIGIILTGTGSDGTRGIRSIKDAGGMVMVQDPRTAEFDGMPQSAINTGLVDIVLPIDKLGDELFHYIDHPHSEDQLERSLEADKEALHNILAITRKATELDFSQYKLPTLIRRIARRMGINKCFTPRTYMEFIQQSPSEAALLGKEILIGVTKFFRDQHVWDSLAQEAIPKRIREKRADSPTLKAWVAGCSTGEEVYTLAILLQEEMARQGKSFHVKIFATDLQKEALEIANKGLYSESLVADINPEYLDRYFTKMGDFYQVVPGLRKTVIFSCHDVLNDPPFSKMDFVFCRNLLIYLQQPAQDRVLNKLHYALELNGILTLGGSESISSFHTGLMALDRKNKVFINKSLAQVRKFDSPSMGIARRPRSFGLPKRKVGMNPLLSEAFNETIIRNFRVVGVYIDESFEIIHAIGETRRFIELPEKGFSANLLRLVPSSLSVVISTSVRKAASKGEAVLYEKFSFHHPHQVEIINISVTPIRIDEALAITYFLVTFIPQKKLELSSAEIAYTPEPSEHILELEKELRNTRENLQATIEEVETSNEELQATNEELMASNEEMQSTNEELQSVNEELYTVNSEYQDKLEEVSRLNAEIENLIQSTQIGTIFLDREMNIQKFTPAIQAQFRLKGTDIGRPLSDFWGSQVERDKYSLLSEAKKVLETETSQEKEVKKPGK